MSDKDVTRVMVAAVDGHKVTGRRRKPAAPGPNQTIQAKFERFHAANPHIYKELVRLARVLKAQGRQRYSISGLYEVVRFDRSLTEGDEPIKLSNNYRSRYARLIMEQEQDLAGFFSIRETRTL